MNTIWNKNNVAKRGQLAHAIVDDLSGEEAALEILEWQRGTFEPCRVAWPERPTISTNWQNLLLMSARARDESGRRRLAAVPNHPEPEVSSSNRRSSSPPPKPGRTPSGPTSVMRPASTLPPAAPRETPLAGFALPPDTVRSSMPRSLAAESTPPSAFPASLPPGSGRAGFEAAKERAPVLYRGRRIS